MLISIMIIVLLLSGCSVSKQDKELAELRQEMEDQFMSAGVAYLGNVDKDNADTYISNVLPLLCEDMAVGSKISQAKVIGDEGDLFCIISNDEKAEITLYDTDEYGQTVREIYKGDGEKPLLVFSQKNGFTADRKASVKQSDGTVSEFMLELDGYGRFWTTSTIADFSPYDKLLKYRFDNNIKAGCTTVTKDDLVNTVWQAQLLFLHDITQTYTLEFAESSVAIRWISGFDEQPQTLIVPWLISQNDGVGVLTLLLGEHGERRYALLFDAMKTTLTVMPDFTTEDQTKRYDERLWVQLNRAGQE